MPYAVADAHVDVLMRMVDERLMFYSHKPEDDGSSGFSSATPRVVSNALQASYAALQTGGIMTQIFAIFVHPRWPEEQQLAAILKQVDCFYERVVNAGGVHAVSNYADLRACHTQGEIAGLMSLEGAGGLLGDPGMLRVLHRLGVRGIGLTWNPANRFADGCMESRNGKLTGAGRGLLNEIERLSMWLDLAHLGDASIDDMLARYARPVMASHANARSVHNHPRNLTDEVISEIIRRKGWLGLTFQSSFLGPNAVATLDDLGRHIDHVLSLGGHDCLGFGSDFDGGITPIAGLESAAQYQRLAEWLQLRYGSAIAEKLLVSNLHRYLALILN